MSAAAQELVRLLETANISLEDCTEVDKASLYNIFKDVVEEKIYFPYESSSQQEFENHFFSAGTRCYVCKLRTGEVIGGFYLKTNSQGRSSHIANAAYMIAKAYRGQGFGTAVVKASLLLAKTLGYTAMQYNLVFSENRSALRLYQKLGFTILTTIPEAILNPDGTYQNGYMMYRSLMETP